MPSSAAAGWGLCSPVGRSGGCRRHPSLWCPATFEGEAQWSVVRWQHPSLTAADGCLGCKARGGRHATEEWPGMRASVCAQKSSRKLLYWHSRNSNWIHSWYSNRIESLSDITIMKQLELWKAHMVLRRNDLQRRQFFFPLRKKKRAQDKLNLNLNWTIISIVHATTAQMHWKQSMISSKERILNKGEKYRESTFLICSPPNQYIRIWNYHVLPANLCIENIMVPK